ncbi:MAG: hypothetical protein JO256_04625, partial [Alphaproteobacteria bacterium]|nr:hypothetical protein [Alphaproteobacteria bacterium]
MNSTSFRTAILAGLGLLAVGLLPTADAAPVRPANLRVLTAADHEIFARAYEAA